MLCHEYGWTVEQCFDRTHEQIEVLTEAINKRKMNELESQVQLHGGKMTKSTQRESMSVDDDWQKLKSLGIAKDK